VRACRRLVIAACEIMLIAGCSSGVRTYSTWASLGERPRATKFIPIESLPPDDARPWGGTVSHHFLANAQIDRWFSELAARRGVELFYILSPSHWGLSTQDYSITDGSWRVPGGLVASNRHRARALAAELGVALEPTVFDPEHGVSALVPYIAKYFPGARVVAVAYRGEPPLDQPMAKRLALALAPAFAGSAQDRNFLLVSADFSHHGDIAATMAKDGRSRGFFESPSDATWILAGCDNRPGIYALASLLGPKTRSAVLYHCDSFALTGQGEDDITSYFFSYFW
jgi:MEMO1 family protein